MGATVDAPMSDERLAEIEVRASEWGDVLPLAFVDGGAFAQMSERDIPALLDEVRRLKRENHLLHLSRGDLGLD